MNEERQYRAEIGHKMNCPDDYMFGLSVWKARAKHDRTEETNSDFQNILRCTAMAKDHFISYQDAIVSIRDITLKALAEQEDTDG